MKIMSGIRFRSKERRRPKVALPIYRFSIIASVIQFVRLSNLSLTVQKLFENCHACARSDEKLFQLWGNLIRKICFQVFATRKKALPGQNMRQMSHQASNSVPPFGLQPATKINKMLG
jgi:hypothetical protein